MLTWNAATKQRQSPNHYLPHFPTPSTVPHWLHDTWVQHEASLTNLLCKIWSLPSTSTVCALLGCTWHCAGSQGHQAWLPRRWVPRGEGSAWAAYRTQQVPSFWRKSLLWRTDTTCLFTLDGICWHFLCAKALMCTVQEKEIPRKIPSSWVLRDAKHLGYTAPGNGALH